MAIVLSPISGSIGFLLFLVFRSACRVEAISGSPGTGGGEWRGAKRA